ncbi:hypothetical protein J3R82DRAFT_1539 [Butyriboletus roseoflavus]|nr:hypothetical protein J3R82DRAFT_1539 [Butyriboletus roseoflavus]
MSSHSDVSSSPSLTSTSNANVNGDMPAPWVSPLALNVDVTDTDAGAMVMMTYFNETGPIYRTEHAQAKEFVKFVRAHVVVVANENINGNTSGNETAWFNWEAFRAAVASLRASDISTEHNLTAIIPPASTTSSDVPDTTIQAILDALVARFASMFTNVLFVPTTSDAVGMNSDENPRTHFFDTLRRNLYCAFTHHLEASDAPERCLSFHRRTNSGGDARARSAWEYRLLFVHSDVQLMAVRGLVMTVTLEGSFEDERGGGQADGEGDEPWYGVSLDSTGPFSGALRAMQVVVGEGFRCP